MKGMKEESGCIRTLTSFERFIGETVREKTLYLILLCILSHWRDFRIGMKFRSFGDSTSSRDQDKLKTIRLCSR